MKKERSDNGSMVSLPQSQMMVGSESDMSAHNSHSTQIHRLGTNLQFNKGSARNTRVPSSDSVDEVSHDDDDSENRNSLSHESPFSSQSHLIEPIRPRIGHATTNAQDMEQLLQHSEFVGKTL